MRVLDVSEEAAKKLKKKRTAGATHVSWCHSFATRVVRNLSGYS
jgi:hypothetical protein